MPDKSKFKYKMWVDPVAPSNDFPDKYKFHCIKSIDELKQALSVESKTMGFDTETTGLNHEDIFMVGYSFCLDGINAYYVPVKHENFGLGEEAIKLIYEKMCNTQIVYMFNMRYDDRVMEYHGFKEMIDNIDAQIPIEDRQKYYNMLLDKQFLYYDMSKVNILDVQAMVFLVDTGNKFPSLKKSEEYFLGWRGASFEETVNSSEAAKEKIASNPEEMVEEKKSTKKKKDVVVSFYHLTPDEAYFYAATDALGTLLLGLKLMPFLKAAKKSGELDTACLHPLMRFENELTLIDVDRLKGYSEDLSKQIEEIQQRCYTIAGEEFNLGSPVDNNRVLTKLNIHTGVTTSRGMSTSKAAIKQFLQSLDKNDPARQLLQDLVNYASLTKQRSSYVDNTIEMCKSKIHPNRLRFSYKNCEVPSGRFAAGRR